MNFVADNHSGKDTDPSWGSDNASKTQQNGPRADTASEGSAAGSTGQTSGASTVDNAPTPSIPAVTPASGDPIGEVGLANTTDTLATDCGSPTTVASGSVTNPDSAAGTSGTATSATPPTVSVAASAPAGDVQSDGSNAGTNPVPTGAEPAGSSSSLPAVTPNTTPRAVTDTLGSDGTTVTGSGSPNTAVSITGDGHVLGTAESNADGTWTFNAATLAPGAYSLVASETDSSGSTSSATPLAVTITDPRFAVVNTVTSSSILLHGSNYAGPVDHLQATYENTASDPSITSALVGNVFIQAGAGENAAVAAGGNNVLSGGTGSSWLVGASGADGGTDTFFLTAQSGQPTWDTLVNFHVGDMLTLWDFNSTAGSITSVGSLGASGSQGETMSVNFGQGSGANTLITFAGISGSAQFTTTAGSSGGVDYSMLTRTA